MNTKYGIVLAIVLIVLIVLVLIFSRQQIDNDDSLHLGGAFALTGFASTWGEADRNGALLALEYLEEQGVNVELSIEDTRSDNRDTLSAIQKFISIDKVDAILGPTWMDSFNAPAPLSREEDIVMMSPSASITAVQSGEQFSNVYSTWYRSDKEMQILPQYLERLGYKRIAILYSLDPYWKDAIKNFKEGLEETSLIVVFEEAVDPQSSDLRTQLTKLKQVQPDVIVYGFSSEENHLGFLRAKADIFPRLSLVTTESVEEFVTNEKYQTLLEGVQFIAPLVVESDFSMRYKERFGVDPIFSASNAYDAVHILVQAFSNTDGTSKEMREYLQNTEFDTVTFRKIRFDEIGGVVGGEFVMKEVKGGKSVTISL